MDRRRKVATPKSNEGKFPTDWSSDGRFILDQALHPKTGYDLWVLPLDGDREPILVLQTEFNETQGQFSPDGHWIAHQSTESTPGLQVYVQGFPKPGGKFQVPPTAATARDGVAMGKNSTTSAWTER